MSRAVIKLMLEEPFFAHFLGKVTRVISKDVTNTAAVGIRNKAICLFVNPDFFLNGLKTKEERIAILKHEVLHLVLKHLFRHQESWHPRTANIAADLSVNQFVHPWPLPDGAVLLENFSVLNLAKQETMEYYYEKLLEAKVAAPQKIKDLRNELDNQSQNETDSRDEQADGEMKPDPDGSEQIDGEKGDAGGELEGPHSEGNQSKQELERKLSGWERIRDILQGESAGNGKVWTDDHEKWKGEEGQAGDQEDAEKYVEDLVLGAAERTKDHGSLPSWLSELINCYLEKRKPQVDWKRSLRLFASNSRRTRIVGTMKRFSKRFGEPSTGIRTKSFQKMAVIIDTSGSVADEDLSLFFGEIHGMWRSGAEITVIECDAAVQRSYPYRGELPQGVAGRGGTVFDPAFQYLRDEARRQNFDGCIYLTDGYACTPTVKPPCKLLWVITPDGSDEAVAFGQAVHLKH